MARLNEPPVAPQPSAEAIDVVKRRFLRQNRELAKTNSQQSIRIRSLENDCSRLLAENLSLREQVLNLHAAAEAQPALYHIDAVRTQLETKLQELSGLVAGLSQPRRAQHGDRRKSKALARRRSGEERQFRSGLGLQEVENAMLPTITEDKYYPRRTIGADELQEGLRNAECSQSPDIGPPPVSRFEQEDPIDMEVNPELEMDMEAPQEEANGEERALSINLETRKKRRESGPKLSTRRVSLFESPEEAKSLEEADETASKSSRTGSKRKFSVQEDEDKGQAKGDMFQFSRRNASGTPDSETLNVSARLSSPERPALSAKPVNTDPVLSPKKQRSSATEKSEKKPQPPPKPRGRARLNITRNDAPIDIPPLPMPEPVLTADVILESLPPKTPAVEDIFSPPSTEPSTQRPESKDTPPPGDLASIDPSQAGRPGRRARPQVSYKEPSLNTKMRRPDAKLVDAIVDRRASADPQTAPNTAAKGDSANGLTWKPVSAVSGRTGEEEVEVGSPLRQKLDRKETSLETKTSPNSVEAEQRSSSSESTSTKEPLVKTEAVDKDTIAVFEFTGSSPPVPAPSSRSRISELAKASRNVRRHSAMPGTMSEDRKTEKAEGTLSSLHKRTGSGSFKSSSTSTLTKSTLAVSRTSTKDRKLPASSSIDLKAKLENTEGESRLRETTALRAERAASRRKSMML